MIYDTVIIGGGSAGYTAALYGARAGLKTLLIEKMSVGGQLALTDIIENYPGFENGINGFELSLIMQRQAEKFGAETVFGEVCKVDLEASPKIVKTADKEFLSKTVIIATGANPRKLGIKGEDELIGRGVSYCATCDGRFFAGKTVAVVGGGNTALGDVLHLSRIAEKVILIHRRDTFRATKVYRDAVEKLENVKIMFDSEVTELFYDNKLKGISVKNRKTGITEKINCDGLFVGIGRNPATELLKGVISTDEKGYISADETTETNIPGVYAVGDVRTKPLRQVATAVSDGAVAIAKAEEYIENI